MMIVLLIVFLPLVLKTDGADENDDADGGSTSD